MKCPKCSYVSHDYLDACRKCGVDLVAFKKDVGLLALQPGVLDLSLVLGEAGRDDLFASMGEDITMHAGNDDDFEMSLDDAPHPPAAQHAHVEAPRAGARETAERNTGLDHLTLELDVSALPEALRAGAPQTAEGSTDLDHLTLDLDVSALSMELAAGIHAAQALPATPPPPPAVPQGSILPGHTPLGIQPDSTSLTLPSGAFAEFTSTSPRVPETAATPVDRSETTESADAEHAEGIDDVVSVTEVSGAMASVSSRDIVLAEDTPIAPEEQVPEIVDLAIPTIEPLDSEAAVDRIEPTHNTFDASDPEEMSLWPGFGLEPDTANSAAETTLDDAALRLTDEPGPPTQPSHELMATAGDATPEDTLTSADISALEDLEESTLPGELIIDLSAPDTGPEQDLTTLGALALGDPDDTTLPEHLTLDFDMSEIIADWSSATLDDLQLVDLPGDVQSAMSPPQNQAGDEEELLLDLDDVASDDDTKA